jgi:hypothetical protein
VPGFALFAYAVLQLSPGSAPRSGAQISPPDSARLVRSARSAQWSFEAFRRQHLPIGYGFSGPCDIRIGRYCYWRGDEDEEHQPEEPAEIVRRRDELLRALDSVSTELPGDAWVAGQRVRYLVEAGHTNDALRYARTGCRASVAWCAALAGYAEHVAGQFAAADSDYAIALAAMDRDERCRWLDISRIVDDATDHRLRALECEARASLTRRILQLAAPLYSVSSTDLYTEHLARMTRGQMAEHAATVDGESWADDQRDLTIRYGWPRWYSRSMPHSPSFDARASVTGHDSGKPYDFMLSGEALSRIGHVTTADWTLDDPRAVTGYAPVYARSVHDDVPSQVALFRRGDSTLVVGAWDARRDTTLLGRPLVAAVAFAGDSAGARVLARDTSATTVGRILGVGVIDSGLVSLELLAVADRRAARVRTGLPARPSGRVALSSLLLYAPSREPAYNIAAVKDSALASAVIPASRAVGVYWETYGTQDRGEPVHYSLTVEQVGVTWARRAAERLHLADRTSALRLQWDEVARPEQGVAGRGVRVDLSRLRAGRYVVTLDVSATNNERASAGKEIVIR